MRRSSLSLAVLFVTSAIACADDPDVAAVASPSTSSSAGSGGSAGGASTGGGAPNATGGSGGTIQPANGGSAGASTGGAAGGTAGSGGSAGASVDPLLAACTTFWTARCHEWSTCAAVELASAFGDEATCVTQNAAECAATTLGPGSVATAKDVASCFAAYGSLDCPAFLRFARENATKPAACALPAGKLAEGSPCVASTECATSHCRTNALGSGCGVCAKTLATGDACAVDADCPAGNACVPDPLGGPGAGVCTAYLDEGAACELGVVPCHADLACVRGTCTARVADGAVCDPQELSCGPSSGCNGAKNQCEPMVVVPIGATCGETDSGTIALCAPGSWCRMIFQDDEGTCIAETKLGQACELDAECAGFASCVAGKCAVADSSLCEGMGGAGGSAGSSGSGGSGGDAPFDHGAPSDVYPAPHPPLPQAKKGPGPVMAQPVVVPIFFGMDSEESAYVDFLTKLVGGTYFATTTSEYGVGAPKVAPEITLDDTLPASMTDEQVRELLAKHLDGSNQAFFPGGGDPLYTFFFPVSTSIDLSGLQSCNGFGGYHDTMITKDGKSVSYAVIPRCAGIAHDSSAVSHELVEAFTDPVVGFPAYDGMDDAHVLWGIDGGEELGDLCEFFKSSTKTDPASKRLIQATWSNASAAASHAPCVPWVGPFFAAAPVMDDDIPLAPLGVVTKGVRVPIGQTRTIEVDLFSDMPTNGDFTVDVFDDAEASGGSPNLMLSLDRASGQNGEKAALTITTLAFDPQLGVARFFVRAQLNGARMSWLGVVGP